MHYQYVLFDLDGTLLPMDQDTFVQGYFKLLVKKLAPHGYEPKALIDAVWKGTAAMVQNNGAQTNEKVFWALFDQLYGEKGRADKPLFDEFYANEFNGARDTCGFHPLAAETVHRVRGAGMTPVLATNPIFPSVATQTRIRWVGLEPEDFALYTTYENCSFCKPNPAYYREILAHLGAKPEQCVMVGNDVSEDMVSRALGMDVFLLTDCLINQEGTDIGQYPNGSFEALLEFLGLSSVSYAQT